MTRSPILPFVVLGALMGFEEGSKRAMADETPREPVLRIDRELAWGGRVEDVEQVLASAARQFWPHFPGRSWSPIVVKPKGGPRVLYQRGPDGEYIVLLNTGDRLWAQHAYQFAHELAHILGNYTPREHPHRWFEESLCELASLYALRGMAKEWRDNPPYPNWRAYASSLSDYADQRIAEARLPPGRTLAEWYREHAEQLAADAYLRDKNTTVAVALLPLLESQPRDWEAVSWLNAPGSPPATDFAGFLAQWHARSAAQRQPFIRQVAAEFGITLAAGEP